MVLGIGKDGLVIDVSLGAVVTVHFRDVPVENGVAVVEDAVISGKNFLGDKMADVAIDHITVTVAPEIVIFQILGQSLAVGWLEVTELVRTLQSEGEVEGLLQLRLKILEGHLVDDDIVRIIVFYGAVGIDVPVHGGVLPAGFQIQRKVVGESAEVGKYQGDAGKMGAVIHGGPPCKI